MRPPLNAGENPEVVRALAMPVRASMRPPLNAGENRLAEDGAVEAPSLQ